jgi:hypothetical protein
LGLILKISHYVYLGIPKSRKIGNNSGAKHIRGHSICLILAVVTVIIITAIVKEAHILGREGKNNQMIMEGF